jgi:ActR/RegA family two-component response regulator
VLKQSQGNVSATARILNVDRRSLYRMLARYKIEPFLKED